MLLLQAFMMSSFIFQSVPADIVQAMNEGSTVGLSSYLDKQVELSLDHDELSASKAEAIVHLKQFFQAHPVRSFQQAHQGNPRSNDTTYLIGNLNTQKGNYRVFMLLRVDAGRHFIQEIRFDPA